MTLTRYLITLCFLFICSLAFGQTGDTVFMKWKLKPGEVIKYKTLMDEKDSANYVNFSIPSAIDKVFGDSSRSDSTNKMMADFFKQATKAQEHIVYMTTLTEAKKDLINIEMLTVDNGAKDTAKDAGTDTSKFTDMVKNMKAMMLKMQGGVALRGSIHEDGTIASFYTRGDQRNLLAGFFELPGKPVRVGDSWPIDIHYVSMDQNFKCDSSFHRNNVTVSRIDKKNGDEIVTLLYDIDEFVAGDFTAPFGGGPIKTTMKMTYKVVAEFSIVKGRWLSYNGMMTLVSTGIMDSRTSKSCVLVAE